MGGDHRRRVLHSRTHIFGLAQVSWRERCGHVRWGLARAYADCRCISLSCLGHPLSSDEICFTRVDHGCHLITSFCRAVFALTLSPRVQLAPVLNTDRNRCGLAASLKYPKPVARNGASIRREAMNIAILGTGGWGTALAVLWARQGNEITLWGHTPERVDQIHSTRQNPDYLPNVELPAKIRLTSELRDCANAEVIVVVTPSVGLRKVAGDLRQISLPDRYRPFELHKRDRARHRLANERNFV